jgi:hypothetical protein
MLSAKGATFMSKPGATPQDYRNAKSPALKAAIHFGHQAEAIRQLNRAFSAGLHGDLNSRGDAPG